MQDMSSNSSSDTRELSLSAYQQQFFQGWLRAQDAIPPPSMISSDRTGTGPLMSSSHTINLVQDAATDCSVVASLCAGTARAERGHDQVGSPESCRPSTERSRCYQTNCTLLTNSLESLCFHPTGNILCGSTLTVVGERL